MAAGRKQQVMVGALFLLSLVVLIGGVLWFKNFRAGQKSVQVTVSFISTSGLVKGDMVEVQGVPSGQVTGIRFEEGHALVDLDIDSTVPLTAGTTIVVENVGIMGQKMVSVRPGPPGSPLPEGTILTGSYQPGIPELMADLGGTLDAFGSMAGRIDSLLASMDTGDKQAFQRALANMDIVMTEMAILMKESRGDMTASLRNLNKSTEALQKALVGKEDQINTTFANAARAAARLDTTMSAFSATLVTVDHTAQALDSLLLKLERGDGTLGKMVNDDSVHDELVATLREMRELVADVERNPKKYVKLSLF